MRSPALTAICQVCDTASTIYQLVQEFRRILHTRSGTLLDNWLEKIRANQIRELRSFVAGIERDKAAVVEGKMNRLKLMKRKDMAEPDFPSCVSVFSMLCRMGGCVTFQFFDRSKEWGKRRGSVSVVRNGWSR